MEDQVNNLNKKWIPAAYINSDMNSENKQQILNNLKKWNYKFIYLTPERVSLSYWFLDYLDLSYNINQFIIDEFDTVNE